MAKSKQKPVLVSRERSPDQKWLDELKDLLRFSWDQMATDRKRIASLRRTADNLIEKSMWPTTSQIPIPYQAAMIEAAVGPALESMFPPTSMVKMIGAAGVDPDVVDRVSWALWLMMTSRMRMQRAFVRPIQDCFTVSVGYAVIEPIIVTPPAAFSVIAGDQRARVLGKGPEITDLRMRHVPAGNIVPYPSGTDFNGSDATPFAFWLDPISEDAFRRLVKDVKANGDEDWRNIDVEEIIEFSRSRAFNMQVSMEDFAEKGAGRRTVSRNNYPNAPGMIPLIKCYATERGRWTWIFPGQEWQIVFDKQDEVDVARCNLIKLDAWSNSNRWFGFSQPEATEKINWGKNILFNAMIDIVNRNLNSTLVYNNQMMDNPPAPKPGGTMGVPGRPDEMAAFMNHPGIDMSSLRVFEQLDAMGEKITGQKDMMSKNFTRGGTMAFQDLLASSGGIDRLRHMNLETGGFESAANQTLIYMQTLGINMGLTFEKPAYDQPTGKDFTEVFSVTEDDLVHGFQAVLDYGEKHRRGSQDAQMDLQRYAAVKDDPSFDKWALGELIFRDPYELNRMRLPRDVVRRKQAEQEAVALAAQLGPAGTEPAPAPGGMAEAVAGGSEQSMLAGAGLA